MSVETNNIKKIILARLQDELVNVVTSNGYETQIKNVFTGLRRTNQIKEFPSVAFTFGRDIPESFDESGTFHIRNVELYIIGYLNADIDENNTGLLDDVILNFFDDIEKFIFRDSTIQDKSKVSSIYNLEDIDYISPPILEPTLTGIGTDKTTCMMIFNIHYKRENVGLLQNVGSFSNTAE